MLISSLAQKINRKIFDLTYRKNKLNLPTSEEIKLVEELRANIKHLQKLQEVHKDALEPSWKSYRDAFRKFVLEDDPRDFLNFKPIRDTMLYEPDIYELKSLMKLSTWSDWSKAISEAQVGNPKPYFAFRESSGTLIHHAYSLSQLFKQTRFSIKGISRILEFGGGYGSMCRLVHQLGFDGQYIIFDLPEFSALQEYFIKSIGIHTKVVKSPVETYKNTTLLLSEFGDLRNQIELTTKGNSLFIATWSISETPLKLRKKIFDISSNFTYYLIAYQEEFCELDNKLYFQKLMEEKANYIWFDYKIPTLTGHRYLIGAKRDQS